MTLVIMAAGMGSRFGGLKQIEPVDDNNNFIIDYSIYDAIKAGYDKGENALAELYDWLFENNRVSDVQKANKDSNYRKDLFDEYVASKKKN